MTVVFKLEFLKVALLTSSYLHCFILQFILQCSVFNWGSAYIDAGFFKYQVMQRMAV